VTFAPDRLLGIDDDEGMADERAPASVDLFWVPLGAGGHIVRRTGRLYEWWSARREHRASADLYHCALMLCLDDTRYAMGPVWNVNDADRGVIAEGQLGRGGSAGSAHFVTSCGAGPGAASRTSPKLSAAQCAPPKTRRQWQPCSTSSAKYPLWPGARRTGSGRDVALQLSRGLGAGAHGPRLARDRAASRRPRAGVECRSRACGSTGASH